ncbi:MAG: uracil-DNA glycosylase [Cyanobacteria bacterium]|nr:uracil-DNA glycosylase [Cyanobacteriota bacterium]MDW8199896.1 uracil-DNA glycosylase [Cyanobacteriota bacterium SKYGB_h_bin112]
MTSNQQIDLFTLADVVQPPSASAVDPDQIPTSANVPILPGTYQTMEQIQVHCNQCQRCVLGETRTNAVIGRGNVHAPIMVVGEGPGQHEDETGLPFVGKAGQLLDKILASVNLTEEDVYICNIVKCRPPGNRDPEPSEVEACKGYLLEQIRIVNPKIILLSGKQAMLALLGIKQGITKVRGQWVERDNRLYMPIFHPAYLLRNQSREKGSPKWLMWQDIQAVRAKLDELASAD